MTKAVSAADADATMMAHRSVESVLHTRSDDLVVSLESRITPQLSVRAMSRPARGVCTMKCRTCGAHATPYDGPLQLLVRRAYFEFEF